MDDAKIEHKIETIGNFINELESDNRFNLTVYLFRMSVQEMRQIVYGFVPALRSIGTIKK